LAALADLEKQHARLKEVNRILRRHVHPEPALASLGFDTRSIRELVGPTDGSAPGIPWYVIRSSYSKVRRLKARVQRLATSAARVPTRTEP
jgi:hypothetical protein